MAVCISEVVAVDSIPQKLSSRIGETAYRLWFRAARFDADRETLRVTAGTRFVGDWIDTHFREELLAVADEEIGPGAAVEVVVDPSVIVTKAVEPLTPRPDAPAAEPSPSPEYKPRQVPLRHDLESFVVGPSNDLAYNAACRVADGSDPRPHILFIHGRCGLGKTHLLQGLCKRYARRNPSGRIRYTTGEQFTNEYIHAVRFNKLGEFRRRIRKLELLAVDDVHFLASKPATQSEFLHTFDAIDLSGSRLVLASDAHPKLIEPMADALVSRFMCGMVVRVDAPDLPTRVRLVAEFARRRGLGLTEAAAEQVARQVTGSVREIEGALTKLEAVASLDAARSAGPIGQALVQRALDNGSVSVHRGPIRIDRIVRVVCEQLMVERQQLMARGRHRRVVLARSLVIHLARKLTTMSYPELAKALGRPNHSTIVTAAQRIQGQIRQRQPLTPADTTLAGTVDQLADHLHHAVLSQKND